jgi:hypothetical protein
MGGRIAVLTLAGLLFAAPAAIADTFSLSHAHSGVLDAQAQGDVTFPDAGGAVVHVTVSDRDEDGWCGDAWVTSNLPPSTQKQYQVCGVAKQQTFTLDLPATARCDVTFVEVTVGRVDPSNGNQTELGQSSRIANPCPPAAVPAPPPPPPPPGPIDAAVTWNFLAASRWTKNETLTVRDPTPGTSVQLSCRGRGCPFSKAHSVAFKRGRANVHRLLGHKHLRPGNVLELRVTRAGTIGKVLRFKIRRNRAPAITQLCMPPGATRPSACR